MGAELLKIEHLAEGYHVIVAYFTGVQNVQEIGVRLRQSGEIPFDYAVIDADLITSRRHLIAATFRAISDLVNDRMKTRNVHSEVLLCLHRNNNIREAFQTFGIGPETTNLLVMKVVMLEKPFTVASMDSELSEVVHGREVSFNDEALEKHASWSRLQNAYKLGPFPGKESGVKGSNSVSGTENSLELQVKLLGIMALRGHST